MRFRTFIKGILICVSLIASTVTYAQSAQDYLAKGINAYANDSLTAAVDYFSKAIKLDPKLNEAYLQRGNAYYTLRKYQNAYDDYAVLTTRGIRQPEVYARKASLLDSAGYKDKAIIEYSNAIHFDSTQGSYYAARGDLYFQKEDFIHAVADFEKAVNRKFISSEIYSKYGYSLMRLNKDKPAVVCFTKAIALEPKDYMDYANRAYTYYDMHDLDLAITDFEHYLENVPDDVHAWYYLARSQEEQGYNKEAIQSFRKVLALKNGYEETWFHLGIVYGNLKDFKDAMDAFDEAVKQSPDKGYLYYNRGVAKLNLGIPHCDDMKKAVSLGYKQAEEVIKSTNCK
jgi:tetratricopeptide (TPR) repeat protein